MNDIYLIFTIGFILILLAVVAYLVYTKQWTVLRETAYRLMLRAEKVFGSGTGKEKFSIVFTELYSLIPPWLRLFVSREDLEVIMQEWYDSAKDWLDDGKMNSSTGTHVPRR